MQGCLRVSSPGAGVDGVAALIETDGGLAYARLRLDLVRLARQVAGSERAEAIVQDAMRYAVKCGAAAPRDARGMPRPAYLASVVHAFAAKGGEAATETAGADASALFGSAAAAGARGG